MARFQKNEVCWIIENNNMVTPVTVLSSEDGFVTVRIRHGAMRIRASRLYPSETEAQKALEIRNPKEKLKEKRVPTPWDFDH